MTGPSEADDYLPLSALEHLLYCERQCALIHVQGVWIENVHTAAGRLLHDRVDGGEATSRPGIRIARSVPIRCDALRLYGIADVVELRRTGSREIAYPVEYKRGPRRTWLHDDVQLAAQAMGLEEMLGCEVLSGAIFYGRSQRRREIVIDAQLRARTRAAAERLHALVASRIVPPGVVDRRCDACSLRDACLPDLPLVPGLLARAVREALR
jgi:CRISPR-associated exonuclease Cas4